MGMVVIDMGEKARKVEKEISDMRSIMKKSSLVLKQRMQDAQIELQEWRGGLTNGSENSGEMFQK